MQIIYSTRRAILDTIDGQPNLHKETIRDMREFQEEFKVIETNDPDYQGFDIPESCCVKYTAMKGVNYWNWLFKIAEDCQNSTYPNSRLDDVFLAIKADSSILSAQVPAGLPSRTYIDSNEASQIHTFATWHTHYELPNNKVVLLTNANAQALGHSEIMAIKDFATANPAFNIEYLNHTNYLIEQENIVTV